MYFVIDKEKNIILEINYWTKILEDYVNKEKSLEKTKNKLIIFIKENKKEIKKINTYSNKKTQTKKEENNVEDLQNFLHNNNSTNSLYSLNYWGLTWDTERENLISEENHFDLEDLYTYEDYDNVL